MEKKTGFYTGTIIKKTGNSQEFSNFYLATHPSILFLSRQLAIQELCEIKIQSPEHFLQCMKSMSDHMEHQEGGASFRFGEIRQVSEAVFHEGVEANTLLGSIHLCHQWDVVGQIKELFDMFWHLDIDEDEVEKMLGSDDFKTLEIEGIKGQLIKYLLEQYIKLDERDDYLDQWVKVESLDETITGLVQIASASKA